VRKSIFISERKSFDKRKHHRKILQYPHNDIRMSILPTNKPIIGDERDRELLSQADAYVYKTTEQGELLAYVFDPETPQSEEKAPAIVFFHGGGWETGSPAQFIPHCLHFKTRGMLTVTLEYRTFSKHRTSPIEAMEDAQTAILKLKENSNELGIDPDKIFLAGAGAGAQLALSIALNSNLLNKENLDSKPAGLILFSPIVDTTIKGSGLEHFHDKKSAKNASPLHMVKKNIGPSIIFHGTMDRIAPFEQTVKFVRLMQRKRNQCKLIDYEGADHSFFNFNVSHKLYDLTVTAADHFLVDLGIIPPDEPTMF